MVRFATPLALLLAASMDASLVQADRPTKSLDTGCQDAGNLAYLARHALDCGDDYAMSDWKVRRCGADNDDIHILYDCEPIPEEGTSVEVKKTDCQIGEENNVEYLDRFDVYCDDDQVLQAWQLNTEDCAFDAAHIDFKCVNIPKKMELQCGAHTTDCDEIYGKGIGALDRHDVVCPGNKLFNKWEMDPDGCPDEGDSQFTYECCDLVAKDDPVTGGGDTGTPPGDTGTPPGDTSTRSGGGDVGSKSGEGGGDGGASGDPHINSWSGETYDFHGGCDLVLLQDPDFANGLGINIHIRTKIKTWWSYIEAAAIQIGKDTLEIQGSTKDGAACWVNRDLKMDLQTESGSFADFPIQFKRLSDHQTKTRIDLGNGDAIGIESFKDFVRVNVHNKSNKPFVGSYGLMGSFPHGEKIGRDGKTIFTDTDKFGQEWMVLPGEPKLFHSESVVKGDNCVMPDVKAKAKRRLGEESITEEDAGFACARVSEKNRDACIFDVMATQDKEMAGSY